MPTLWAEFVGVFKFKRADTFKHLLDRTRDVPVTIVPESSTGVLVWAVENLDRVGALDCPEVFNANAFGTLWAPPFVDKELPHLRDLRFAISPGGGCYRAIPGTVPLRAHSLLSLSLAHAHVPFYTPRLTRLSLLGAYFDPPTNTGRTVDELLDALQHCLLLEHIDITYAISMGRSTTWGLHRRCRLPRLTQLAVIRTHLDAVHLLFEALEAPELRSVRLQLAAEDRVVDILNLPELRRVLSLPEHYILCIRCKSGVQYPSGKDFELVLGALEHLRTAFSYDYLHQDTMYDDRDGFRFSLDQQGDPHTDPVDVRPLSIESTTSILEDVSSNIRCVGLSLSTVFLSGPADDWVQRMRPILRACLNVVTVEVVIDFDNHFSVVRALLNPRDSEFIFPRLHTLNLKLVRKLGLRRGDHVAGSAPDWMAWKDNGVHLRVFIEERAAAGCPLDDVCVVCEDESEEGAENTRAFRSDIHGFVGHLLSAESQSNTEEA
ncbi:unnamed protein product [Peniophora sp. CBMAI 1063]|nr:unnamed protein product [Peniophora sp. CBMAI 1063]